MEETPATKTCGQCGVEKELTPEFYGVQTASADGFRSVCRVCFSDNRSAEKMRDVKNLKNHDRIVKAAKKALEKPELLPPNQLHKMNQIVNGDEKKRAKLQAKIQEAHRAEEDARKVLAAGPSLARVRALGSELFAADGTLLPVAERPVQLARLKAALEILTGPADEAARAYLQTSIQVLEKMLANAAEREAFLTQEEQDTLNERVSRRVIGKLYDIFLPQIRAAITAEAKISLREQIRERKKKLMATAKTATGKDSSGADKVVVAKTVADALEKLALMLYSGTKAPLPSDTLANIQSRQDAANAAAEWLERAEFERQKYWSDLKASDIKRYERESKSLLLQIRGDGPFAATQRKSMAQLKREDPALYEKLALEALKPRKVVPDVVIWVVMEGKRETWLWPSGKPVLRGTEITYDTRLKYWALMPGPAGVQLDSPGTGRQTLEWYQDENDPNCTEDGPVWKQRPVDSAGVWEQKNDGTFKRTDSGVSPWQRPEKIVFRKAELPASPAHTEMRHGKWFTPEEVKEVESAGWTETPPTILPPLPKHAVADSLSLPPERPHPEDHREPYVWRRFEQAEKERKAREAELLRA